MLRARSALVAALFAIASGPACRRPPPEREAGGGVEIEVASATGLAELRGPAMTATMSAEPAGLQIRAIRALGAVRGPISIDAAIVSASGEEPLGLHALHALRVDDAPRARAFLTHPAGDVGTLDATIEPRDGALVIRARGRDLPAGARLSLRVRAPRRGSELRLGDEPPERDDAALPAPRPGAARPLAPWIVVGGARPLVFASTRGLAAEATVDTLLARAEQPIGADGTTELSLSLGVSGDAREGAALGARLAAGPRRKGALLAVEVRASDGGAIPARLLIEGTPSEPPPPDAPAMVLDPTREAERGAPLVDAYQARTTFALPKGRWTLLATHGIGWSIAKTTLDLADGDALRVPITLTEEAKLPGWIGCDLHVHARGSTDARAVSYEDRVRSLTAVGVDCAAATEHDHEGTHEPAAKALGLDPIFRALPGVELTTNFGHFNAYPWPVGAPVPLTRGTDPRALFGAVRALPGGRDLVLQVNHPRMRAGEGSRIGYFELSGYDGATGAVSPQPGVPYLDDYDALEVFNGYQLPFHEAVLDLVQEWIAMLDRGVVHVATGSSDSHWIQFPWAGFPRTYVKVGPTWATEGRPLAAVATALKRGRAIVSSGPLLDVRIGAAGIGDEVSVTGTGTGTGGPAKVRVEVRGTSWLDAPTLQLFVGRDRLAGVTLVRSPTAVSTWVAEAELPKVTRRRPLVAVATAKVLEDGRVVKGMTTAVAFANPIWLVP
jgi:hypothetical protein